MTTAAAPRLHLVDDSTLSHPDGADAPAVALPDARGALPRLPASLLGGLLGAKVAPPPG